MCLARYHKPRTLAEAFALMAGEPGARYVAGGTDVMTQMRAGAPRFRETETLISLRAIPEIAGVEVHGAARVGALTSVADLVAHPEIGRVFPVLRQAGESLGSPQIRNMATVGGNLANASPCADLAPPLLVLEATVRLEGPAGTREMPLESFFTGPGETRLAPGEVLAQVSIPAPREGVRAAFVKKGRVAMDLALASVALLIEFSGRRVLRARAAAGSVAPTPLRLFGVEAALEGRELTPSVLREARAAAEREVAPICDLRAGAEHRRRLASVLVARMAEGLLAGAG